MAEAVAQAEGVDEPVEPLAVGVAAGERGGSRMFSSAESTAGG